MAFKAWTDFQNFEQEVRFRNRFVYSSEVNEFLINLKATLPSRERSFTTDRILYRSQIGHYEEEYEGEFIVQGHPPKRMKPKTKKAHEGRANPKGIPYLYLCNDENTSMAELRPHVGQHISCAQFKVSKDLRLIDCYSVDKQFTHVQCIFNPPETQEDVSYAIWSMINDAFTKPVTNDHSSSEYVPTQILAELFKHEGYDGICCKSHMGIGHNFILFDLELANLTNCTVMETKAISFNFSECANRYFVQDSSQDK